MNKKFIIFAFTITMMFSNTVVANSFSDVPSNYENADAIDFVQSEGIVHGYEDGTFKPDQEINRAEFTKIIMKADYNSEIDSAEQCFATYNEGLAFCGTDDGECGIPVWNMFGECMYDKTGDLIEMDEWDKLADYEDCFPDVKEEDWFKKYVCYAKFRDIIEGYEDGRFQPDKTINFVEAAKIILEAEGYDLSGLGDNWYHPYVGMLGKQKAIPVTINSFNKEITRGEMAEMIYRLKDISLNFDAINSLTYSEIKNGPEKVQSKYATYKQWIIPSEYRMLEEQDDMDDCIGVENGLLDGGDLLSTLIADEDARSTLHLDVYTQDYLKELENKIVKFSQENMQEDFYAIKVCHMKGGVDIVIGKLWKEGEPTTEETEKYGLQEKEDFANAQTDIFVINEGDVYMYSDIKALNTTATGAEVQTCHAELKDNSILWSCFMGLHFVDENTIDGADMKYWSFPLDGGATKSWEETDVE